MLRLISVSIPDIGTFGRIYHTNGSFLCCTVEREWLNNEPSISCVPAGLYELVKKDSPTFGPGRYYLENHNLGVYVEPHPRAIRTHCLLHGANFPYEVEGCVAPGLSFMEEKWGVSQSRDALLYLEDTINRMVASNRKLEIIRNEI